MVRERFRQGIDALQLTSPMYPCAYPFAPPEVMEHFRTDYGPANRAFSALDASGQADLRRGLEQLWTQHNGASDGTTRYEAEYLEVVAVRAQAKAQI